MYRISYIIRNKVETKIYKNTAQLHKNSWLSLNSVALSLNSK